MLIRVCLIVAIVAGLAASGISFFKVRERLIETMDARDQFERERNQERAAKQKAQTELKLTQETLTTTSNTLVRSESNLRLMTERFKAEETRAISLATQLERTRNERDDAQRSLARFEGLGTPDELRNMIASFKTLEEQRDAFFEESRVFSRRNDQLRARLDLYEDPTKKPPMPGVKGTVLAVDPKYDFVILDIGEDDGVLERGELLVNRDGQFVAKLEISSVQPKRSVANVLPAWKRDEVMEGDLVFY
jgi:hypothetical protein